VSNCDNDIDVVTKTLENDSMELINWFSLNLMKAKPLCIILKVSIAIVLICRIFNDGNLDF
jgi:hypothetical protein